MMISKHIDLPPFQFPDVWDWVEKTVTPEERNKINRELKEFQEQNTAALQQMFLLGFGAGVRFAQEAYEKERRR